MQPQQPFYQQPGAFQVAPEPYDNKRNMIYKIIGALLVLAIVLVILSLLFKSTDTTELVKKAAIRHDEELRLNEIADNFNQNDYDLQLFRANLSILANSDAVNLRTFIEPARRQSKQDKQLVASLTDVGAEARFLEAGSINKFIAEYKDSMTKLLETNLEEMKSLKEITKEKDLKSTLDVAIHNHETLIKQIDKLE